ncbi:hypothetical protein EAI_02324 [Harpegnathos saltator]|uniref:Odorant receptor 13a n=1 Tax=Harpegnathos saltator TaxID=610380 RepID=E2BZL3_HARSA|nr:hypothetical protein EAI_02324 [Harpegnathos saltator]
MIPCFLHMILEAEDVQSKLNVFGPLLHRIMGLMNYMTLLKHRSDIRDSIQQMEKDWLLVERVDDREIMLQQAKLGRLIALISGIIMQGGTLLYSIAKAMKPVTIVVNNDTLTMYPMTCPSYRKFIDTRFSPMNEIMLVVQFMSTFVVGSSIVGVCSLAAVFATHTCGQLDVLYKRLDELDKEDERGNYIVKEKMVDIVERHLKILRTILPYVPSCSSRVCQYCPSRQCIERFRKAIMTNTIVLKNVKSKSDHDYSLKLNRWYLKPIGAWPLASTSSAAEKVVVLIQILVCWVVVCFIVIPCTLYLFFEKESIRSKVGAVAPLLNRYMGLMSYWMLLQHSGNIRDCIEHIEMDWRSAQKASDREVMLQHAKFGQLIALICGIIMQGGTFLYGIAKAAKTATIIVGNETITMHPMTCPAYSKIIDTRFSPVNEIVLIIQILSTFIVSSSTAGICSLAAVFAIHASGQLNILYMRLDELTKNRKEENHVAEQRIIDIVEHHLRILSLQLSRWFLISIGAWPQTRTSSIIERLSSIILVPMWLFMVAVITIPCLLYVFFEAKGIQTKLRPLGPLFHRIMGTLNYWILLTRGKAIHECIKHMEEDWRVTENIQNYEIMIKHAKMSRYMAGVCAMFMQGSALFFNIVGTIKTVNIVIKNETITIHPLSCPAYRKLIDARFNPANKIMLLMQFMSSYITNSSTVCICSLAIVFAMHACGQLNMLHTWFNQLVEDHAKGKHLTKRRIGNIVRHHLRVLWYLTAELPLHSLY